jgi:hypothetical protein
LFKNPRWPLEQEPNESHRKYLVTKLKLQRTIQVPTTLYAMKMKKPLMKINGFLSLAGGAEGIV